MSARELEEEEEEGGRTAGIAKGGQRTQNETKKESVRGLELKQERERERDKMTAAKRKG